MEYRIDELAREAGTTIRNIRAYQDRGILPPPRREGRVAWYSEAHLARLRVVAALLERGYSIANIAEIVGMWERGGDLRDLLGLEAAITSPFTDELPEAIGLGALIEMFGTVDPGAVAKAVEIGLLELHGTRVVVPSMRQLRAGAELFKSGVPLKDLLRELGQLKKDMDRIAARLVDMVATHMFPEVPAGKDAAKLAERVKRIRPLAEMVVTTQLAFALEKHVRARLGERIARLLQPNLRRMARS